MNIMYGIILLYLLIIFVIGVKASIKVSQLSDFVLADRKLSGWITALGAGAADMSGWLLMALPGLIFIKGLSGLWLPLFLVIGAYCNWHFIGQRLRIYTKIANDSLTIPSFLSARFINNRYLNMVTAIIIIIFFTIYASANFIMCAKILQEMLLLDYHQALIIGAVVMVSYTCLGGFLAINWIDFFQGILMFVCLLVVPVYMFFNFGNWELLAKADTIDNYTISFFNIGPLAIISSLAWGLGYFGQIHILTRFMAIKNYQQLPLAKRVSITWMFLSLLGAILCGFFGRVYYDLIVGVSLDPEMVFIKLATDLFAPWIAAILISAVLSAIMSTVTAQILNASSSLVEDIYHHRIKPQANNAELVLMARVCVVIIAIFAVWFAYNYQASIMIMVEFAWSGLGATFGPVILLSLYWRKLTAPAVVCGMIIGAIAVLIWEVYIYMPGYSELSSMLPGFFSNLLVLLLISKVTTVSSKMLEDFNRMLTIIKTGADCE